MLAGAGASEPERREAVRFREALRSLLRSNHGEPLDQEALATLQEVASDCELTFSYRENGDLDLEPADQGVHGALARLQAVVYRAMLQGTWRRLKICLSDTCQWAFYDASKNRSGRWCSMEVCGNRMKVRSHRRRKSGVHSD
jgi:predicted RNA-binding Zn ribbon-like protein